MVKLGAGWLVGDMVNGNVSDGDVDVVIPYLFGWYDTTRKKKANTLIY